MKQTVAFEKNARNVFFHILTKCNLSCKHCYINPLQHGKNTLDIGVIKKWLAALASLDKKSNVIFLGGEPTLHPDLDRAVLCARRLGYNSVTIDTNGYLFSNILSKIRPLDVDFFSFSLDGPDSKINDALRGRGCFDACVSGIQKAVAAGFGVSLIYTVSSGNLAYLARMPQFLAELGVRRFFIQVIGVRGKAASDKNVVHQLTREQWTGVVPEVAAHAARLGIETTYPKVFLDLCEAFECAGKVADNFFIFPNGRVYKCPLCEDYPMHSLAFEDNKLTRIHGINEAALFDLNIPEGCVMNRLIQPGNVEYDENGNPLFKIACCLLKEKSSLI